MAGQQRTNFRTWEDQLHHRKKVIKKLDKIQGLQALLTTWEAQPQDSDAYRTYIRDLRRKLRAAETQYQAMQP
jgi:hypothetical protein